ncbi:hypothetical protein GCWU000282_00626 [Catonella morbi ATCC 51271]|uniref:Uncharacterized protein n=1 Tax=Catonella morbi ATCC 51271 TaxID=592026 RepID=V2Y846_9FIRM|nr:hypothetical protein GCWU000282_00626 [Catonella morbi ATCC 51271]
MKPKQSCIIGCQILLTPTSFNGENMKFIKRLIKRLNFSYNKDVRNQ